MKIRDRIVELRRVRASDLRANPRNWRTHPARQREAISAILQEVGYAGALLARETPAGLELIDGHLRAETTPEELVPVLVLDVDETEAMKLLATLDPIASMAETDARAMERLIDAIGPSSERVQNLLDEIAAESIRELELPEPPETVEENIDELEEIRRKHKDRDDSTARKGDTETYLVLVYRSREAREAVVRSLGLPADERYCVGEQVEVKARHAVNVVTSPERSTKAASAKKSGAGG